MAAMTNPPANTDNMMRQLAIPVASSMAAPISMQRVEVSPTEPGIRPTNMSHNDKGSPMTFVSVSVSPVFDAICPRGVAPENPSTTAPSPNPHMLPVDTNTLSPLIFDG